MEGTQSRRITRPATLAIVLLLALAPAAGATEYVLITLLYTNDMHGRVMPDADPGLAKLATLVREIREDMPNVLLIDGGDIIHGSYEDYLSGHGATISAMNAALYNAAVTGNHEYDFGLAVTRGAVGAAAFPMLAANVKDRATGPQWDGVLPYIVMDVRGVRIGILGLATLDTVALQWPPSIAEIRIDDPIETARTVVPEVRRRADVVVVLSHLGYKTDRRLAEAVPGIDFIVGGHSHTMVDTWQWVGDTLIAQAGAYARYLGRIDLIVAIGESGGTIVSVNGRDGRSWNELPRPPLGKLYPTSPLIPVSLSLPEDAAVVEAYRPYRERANALLDEVIGEALEAIPTIPSDSGETPAGNLVADAVRSLARSDISVIDAASVSAGLSAGPVTRRGAFDMIGGFTRQRIIVVRLTGTQIVSGLASALFKDRKLGLQVSGVAVSYSSKADGTAALAELQVDGIALDPNKEYTVAGQAYIIQELMSAYPSAAVVAEPAATTREAVVEYVRSTGRVRSPGADRVRLLAAPR